jgi:hypothetical protein
MTDDHLITVDAVQGGWRVAMDDLTPLMFLSGGRAEVEARRLAGALNDVGDDARVLIRDRANTLVGSRRYYAE